MLGGSVLLTKFEKSTSKNEYWNWEYSYQFLEYCVLIEAADYELLHFFFFPILEI